jgi:hypothetical protein
LTSADEYNNILILSGGGKNATDRGVLLAHGLTKEKKVPDAVIDRAIKRKKQYEQDPEKHKAGFEVPEVPDDL